jgi:hypothetical protein
MGARTAAAVLGVWLFFSAFLWPHGSAQFHNAWITGVLAVTAAMAGLHGGGRVGALPRHVHAALGGWLLVSSLLMQGTTSGTFWNHVFVGFGLLFFGVSPSLRAADRRAPVQP